MNNKIALKLVCYVVVFSSILAVLGSFVQLSLDYYSDLRRVTGFLRANIQQQLPNLSRFIEDKDTGKISSQLEKTLIIGELTYAAVIVDDYVIWQQGVKSPDVKNYINTTFSLPDHINEDLATSRLEVSVDIRPLLQNRVQKFFQMLITKGVKIFLIAGFTLIVVQYLITRHLTDLAGQLAHFDSSKPYIPIKLARKPGRMPDEFDQLVSGFNEMQGKATDAYHSLAKSEQRLLLFLDSTEEAIIGIDKSGICTFTNNAGVDLLCLKNHSQIIGKKIDQVLAHTGSHMSEQDFEESIAYRSMAASVVLQSEDMYIATPEGTRVYVSLRCYPVLKHGEVTGAVIFMNDNSEKKSLIKEKELLIEAVDHVPLMIIIANNENIIEYVNIGAERLTGYRRSELVGRNTGVFAESLESTKVIMNKIGGEIRRGKQWEGVLESRSKSGKPLTLFCIISPVLDNKKNVTNIISVSREISYELGLQDELMNARKMEAVGRLSSNFAHEFGNPLFGIRSVITDFYSRKDLSEDDKQLLSLASEECERMRGMVKEFQQLYQDYTGGDHAHNINTIIENVLADVGPIIDAKGVQCSLQFVEYSERIKVDRGGLSLVLKNIIVNAIESMAGRGGGLNISTEIEGNYFNILLEDGGSGIKSEHQELVFEPFFSTKPAVEGAGLGLSVAFATMKRLGGSITFESREGEGTIFTIHVPLSLHQQKTA